MAEGPGNRNRRENVEKAAAVPEEKERRREVPVFFGLILYGRCGAWYAINSTSDTWRVGDAGVCDANRILKPRGND
jgi:hypothetical protein